MIVMNPFFFIYHSILSLLICDFFFAQSNAFSQNHPLKRNQRNLHSSYGSTSEEEKNINRSLSIVENCYNSWNDRKMNDAVACFSDNFTYDDGQYLGSIKDKGELEKSFKRNANILPSTSKIVIDNIAVCSESGNIGTQWRVVKKDGETVPFTRGCSFYTIDKNSGLIKTGVKVSEMLVKPPKLFSDTLVSSASSFTGSGEKLSSVSLELGNEDEEKKLEYSIIETYFQAWNKRDMEAALDCFVDDCLYETEDPVFVDKFKGKDALRSHLVKNAASLPSSCSIILDDLAIDSKCCGVKWHLEVGGIPIPNLRGCSMYKMDEESGLLKTGYDVTESPVKLPGLAQEILTTPFKALFSKSS